MTKSYDRQLFKDLEGNKESVHQPFPIIRFTLEEIEELNRLADTFIKLKEAFGSNNMNSIIKFAQHYVTNHEALQDEGL